MEADVVVIGAGPAGLQAGIHAARRKAVTVVIGRAAGSALSGVKLENYFGFSSPALGSELLAAGAKQAETFGCRMLDANVTAAASVNGRFRITAESGEEFLARAVILATGISRVKLGVPGEKEYLGKGVSYCAACDCNFYKGRTVAVYGGQSEAAASAELMTKYAAKVYWVAPLFEADPAMVVRAEKAGVQRVIAAAKEIAGEAKVTSLRLTDGHELKVDGVFIELGGRSSADLAMDLGLMPEIDNTVAVDRSGATAVPGVFACGDITGRPWQVAKAVGEGAVAGTAAADFVKKMNA